MLPRTQIRNLQQIITSLTRALSSASYALHAHTNCFAGVDASARGHVAFAGSTTIGRRRVGRDEATWLGLAASSGLAAALLLQQPAHCEAQGDNAGTVKAAITELWLSLDEQLHRLDASRPRGAQLPRIPEPEVDVSGGRVTVTFHLPQALDVAGGVAELNRRLRSPHFPASHAGAGGSALTESRSTGPTALTRRFRRSSPSLGDLTVDVVEPHDRSQPATLTFSAPADTASTGDALRVVAAALAAAARPRRRDPGSLADDLGGLFQGSGGFPSLGALDPLLGPLRELLEEFDRTHQESPWGDGSGRPVPIEPAPPRRAKHFEEVGPQDAEPEGAQPPAVQAAVRKLRGMGAQVFLPQSAQRERDGESGGAGEPATREGGLAGGDSVDWGTLAGYEEQKRAIEDCLLLPLLRPDVYDAVARGTRARFAPNRPRALLFVGPPGTGKTTSARVIAAQASVPLVYLPLEALVSKWYGESERQMAEALALADSLPGGCIVFIDELDALATSRGEDGMHEATRRLLGCLLRHIDGFDASKRSVVVGATNRPQDLDPALLNRFSATVEFGLPGEATRAKILGQYAHHLKEAEVAAAAAATPGMAGRDLRDVCEQAERRWAAKIIRGRAEGRELPPLEEYLTAAAERAREMGGGGASGAMFQT